MTGNPHFFEPSCNQWIPPLCSTYGKGSPLTSSSPKSIPVVLDRSPFSHGKPLDTSDMVTLLSFAEEYGLFSPVSFQGYLSLLDVFHFFRGLK